MLKQVRAIAFAVLAVGVAADAAAQRASQRSSGGFDASKIFYGGGLSLNEVSGSDNGTGFQIFGGYRFGEFAPKWQADVEVGYMDTGNMKVEVCFGPCVSADARAKGLWSTGVARYILNPQVELLGRAGLDFGDDDGFMFGFGAGYNLNRNVKLRGEYVIRENVDSIQFNVVYTP
jgi:Outer membrane protein beta-barrel domain